MKILVVVRDPGEVQTMKRLLATAGVTNYYIAHALDRDIEEKPSMKLLRQVKPVLDKTVRAGFDFHPYDYILAVGETAARLVLDTSAVNINKLRGRDLEYVEGTKSSKSKKTAENSSDDNG